MHRRGLSTCYQYRKCYDIINCMVINMVLITLSADNLIYEHSLPRLITMVSDNDIASDNLRVENLE